MPDPKLVDFVRSANVAEAKTRYRRLLERAGQIATENYVRCLIEMGHAAGYDLTQGDVALVHPDDLPPTVKFVEGRDPVYALIHPAVIPGKVLYARKNVKYLYLAHGRVVH